MYPAFTASVATSILGLLAGALALAMSRGPGWRPLRWYAWSALAAAAFTGCNAFVTLPVSDLALAWLARAALCFAGLHGAALIRFAEAQGWVLWKRKARVLAGLTTALALGALLPEVFVTSQVHVRKLPALGLLYRDALPSRLGEVLYAYYCAGLFYVALGFFRAARRGARGAIPSLLAVAMLVVGGVNDSLAASGSLNVPYLLDLALFGSILCVGVALSSRFVASAHALESSSRALHRTQTQLVQKERLAALGELSAVVAHEVRNPVAIILNAVTTLRRLGPRAPEDTDTLLDIVDEEALRLKRIVDTLLQFVRPLSPRFLPVELGSVVRSAAVAAESAQHCEAQVRVLSSVELPLVRCDEQLIHQALVNLIANGLQATGRRTPVQVELVANSAGDGVEVRIDDDGAGVPEALISRLFTPFHTTRPTGTGLGLAVVRRIAEAHGGMAAFRPRAGGGARFLLELPFAPPESPSEGRGARG